MKLSRSIAIGLIVLAIQLPAFAGEIAVLRNGFTIRCERKQQSGTTTRLYTSGGFLDVPTAEIASFEPDDTPNVDPGPSPTASAAVAWRKIPAESAARVPDFGDVAAAEESRW